MLVLIRLLSLSVNIQRNLRDIRVCGWHGGREYMEVDVGYLWGVVDSVGSKGGGH